MMKNVYIVLLVIAPFFTSFAVEPITGAFGLKFGDHITQDMVISARKSIPKPFDPFSKNYDYLKMKPAWYTINPPEPSKVLSDKGSIVSYQVQIYPNNLNGEVIRIYAVAIRHLTSKLIYNEIRAIAEALKEKYQLVSESEPKSAPLFVFKGDGGYLQLKYESSQRIIFDYISESLYNAWLENEKARIEKEKEETKNNAKDEF